MKPRLSISIIITAAILFAYIGDYINTRLENWLLITLNIPNIGILFISEYLKVNRREKGECKLRKKDFVILISLYSFIGVFNFCIFIMLKTENLFVVSAVSFSIIFYEILAYLGFQFKAKESSQEELDQENDNLTNELIESIKRQKSKCNKE